MKKMLLLVGLVFTINSAYVHASIEGYMALSNAIEKSNVTAIHKLLPLYLEKLSNEHKTILVTKARNRYADLKSIAQEIRQISLTKPIEFISPIFKNGFLMAFSASIFGSHIYPFFDSSKNENFDYFAKKLIILGISAWFFKEGLTGLKNYVNLLIRSSYLLKIKSAEEIKEILEQTFNSK